MLRMLALVYLGYYIGKWGMPQFQNLSLPQAQAPIQAPASSQG